MPPQKKQEDNNSNNRRKRYNYKKMLEDDVNLKRWYDNLKRSSPANADKCLQRVGYVCRVFGTTPKKMARMSSKDGANLILDVLSELEKGGKQPTYMQDYIKALKSWFHHNEINITQKFKLPKSKTPTKVAQEQSPTPDLFRRVLNAADLKQKVEATLVGLAGLRPEVIGDYTGDDGLQIRDFPEIEIDHKTHTVSFKKIPTMIIVRENLSKAGHQYFTFYPFEGCQYLKELLEFRMRARDEKLDKNTPIINSINFNPHHTGHIRTINIGDSIRGAIRKAGFDWRPYILRTYFDTRMMMAEADKYIIKDWRTFWMGHTGDIEAVYTVNKRRLPEDLVEKMREAFAKSSERYLVTIQNNQGSVKDMVIAQFNKQFLQTFGYTEDEITALGDLSTMTPADINKLLQDKTKKALGLNGNSQKVVPLGEVKEWILQGWEYKAMLPTTNEAIIQLPNIQGG